MRCCGRKGVIFCAGSERSWSVHPPPRVGPGRVRETEGGGALSRRRRASSTGQPAVQASQPPPAGQAINTPSIIKQTLTWPQAARDPRLASEQRPAPTQLTPSPGTSESCQDRSEGNSVRPAGACPDPWGAAARPCAGPRPARRIGDHRTPSRKLHPILGDSVCPGKQVNSVEIFSRLPWPFLYSFTSQAFNSPFA